MSFETVSRTSRLLPRAVIGACWLTTTAAVVVAALTGHDDGFSLYFEISHMPPCPPPLAAGTPHQDVVGAAATISVLILVVAAALRFQRWLVPLALAQALVSGWLSRLEIVDPLPLLDPTSRVYYQCAMITEVYPAVDHFRTSIQVAVVAGPVLLLLVAIMRLRQPRPDPPLPPASVRRRLWDLLR